MPTKKKAKSPASKKSSSKKAAVKSKKKSAGKPSAAISIPELVIPRGVRPTVLYVDSSFFFPLTSTDGYTDDFQSGRYTLVADRGLQAAIILPVGTTIRSITIYYKNTTSSSMFVAFLKKHIDHHCPSGEVEVSLDNCPPGSSVPDDYIEKFINHFDAGGVILDKYLYFLQILNTGKFSDKEWRTVRGIRIEYV
jgi:hypothetical protein